MGSPLAGWGVGDGGWWVVADERYYMTGDTTRLGRNFLFAMNLTRSCLPDRHETKQKHTEE